MKTSKSSLLIWNVVTVSESLQSASWVRHQCCVNTLIEFFAIEHIGRLSELYSASMALCNFTKLFCYFTWKHNNFRPPDSGISRWRHQREGKQRDGKSLILRTVTECSCFLKISWKSNDCVLIVFQLFYKCILVQVYTSASAW